MSSFALSVENVLAAIGITLLSVYYIFLRENRKLPPSTEHNLFELLSFLTNGQTPAFLFQCMKDRGPVFRLILPQMDPFIVVCDPDLAKKIFEEEDEKPALYQKAEGLTAGISNMFTMKTHGNDYHKIRKCMAPSFSNTNIFSALPRLHEKIDLLKKIFLQNEMDNRSFDLSVVFPRLLMDMLCTTMFDIDYHTLEVENGEGRQLMGDLHLASMEFSKGIYHPLRNSMFWLKEQREAKAAALRAYHCQKKLLDNYRANNTPEEIEKSVSIMAHLIKTPYKSDMERCADMTVFTVAGHDTTSFSIAWNIIEVAKQPHIYQKIKAEIDSIVGKDVYMTHQHLSKMVYLDNTIKEGMRMYPVAAQVMII
jgi:cytochrome P450